MLTKKTTLLLLKILEKVTSNKKLHSKWLNTLSYLEYIGTRKILKSLSSTSIDIQLLEHINEESRHSLFFKKLAYKQTRKPLGFRPDEMISSQQASDYFQKVDHYASKFSFANPMLNYFYTTYVVERRVLIVYTLYNDLLKRKKFSFSLQSILNDEKEHFDFVLKKIKETDLFWKSNLEDIKHFEHQKYFSLLIAFEQELFQFPSLKAISCLKNSHHSSLYKI